MSADHWSQSAYSNLIKHLRQTFTVLHFRTDEPTLIFFVFRRAVCFKDLIKQVCYKFLKLHQDSQVKFQRCCCKSLKVVKLHQSSASFSNNEDLNKLDICLHKAIMEQCRVSGIPVDFLSTTCNKNLSLGLCSRTNTILYFALWSKTKNIHCSR
jgi:hypothetical protein